MSKTLLWEVGCEELPAWSCEAIERQLPQLVLDALADERLLADDASPLVHVGPRRFSVLIDVLEQQPEEREEARGPAVRAAFEGGDPSGAPTKACEGFARSRGLTPDQLTVREDNGTPFVFATRDLPSEPFAAVWPKLAERIIGKLSFAKPMRWGTASHRFVRPIRWIVTLLGDSPIEYELWGVSSGAVSRTHRFLGDDRETTLTSANEYVESMRSHDVIVDQHDRRTTIEQGLAEAANTVNGSWNDPGGVLREVVHLVEQPTVLTGSFDERYLQLPERVLVTAMQSHQRYFPVQKGGGLAPAFLTVMNGDPAAADSILPGYERVLAGRLDDAVFSFDRDRDRGLDDMATAESLGAVVFHAKAGSLADRRDRISAAALEIASQLEVDETSVSDAARLSKADQVSTVVQEFAELEGFVGSLYAADADYDATIAMAIDQQFMPRGADDALPAVGVASVLALADKLEILVTMFAIGELPTGSRDPFALRRAAIGIVRIILEHDLPVNLHRALQVVADTVREQGFGDGHDQVVTDVHSFIMDRVEKHLANEGVRIDAIRAARAATLPLLQHTTELAQAMNRALQSGSAELNDVLLAVNRCRKILEKADSPTGAINESALSVASESELYNKLTQATEPIQASVEARDFDAAIARAAGLGPAVAAFFDTETGVMVMADDAAERNNRLLLVQQVLTTVAPLGDLGELQVDKQSR